MAATRRPTKFSALPMQAVHLPMQGVAAVLAAGELGVFAALQHGPRSLAALARTVRATPWALLRLCDQLVATGWLVRRRNGFANTKTTQGWFTSSGTVDYTAGLLWTQDAWRLQPELAAAVRQGGPRRSLWARMQDEPGMGDRFAAYMLAFARHTAPRFAGSIRVPRGATRLLDVGGSHGLHAIAACAANPGLHAVVLDQAVSLRGTKANVRAAGLQDRVSTRVGDAVHADLGTAAFDVVYCFSVAHNLTAAANARLLRRCARAMRPGGLLVIHDYVRDQLPEPYASAFDLTLLVEVGTHTHDLAAFRRWLADAGLAAFRHRRLSPSEMGSLITARKPH
jgi:SAM-dependent methyltransferase